MAQQTAVDWLFEQIPAEWSSSKSAFDAYQQAKQMEKEQQKTLFDCGKHYEVTGEGTFKQVYQELYGKQ